MMLKTTTETQTLTILSNEPPKPFAKPFQNTEPQQRPQPLKKNPETDSKTSYWGGRIRTSDARYQKPLPYRLATPQRGRDAVYYVRFFLTTCKSSVR